MQRFLSDVAEILEVDSVTPELEFRNVPYWDSLKGFALLVLLENDYGRRLTIGEFQSCRTVGDLAALLPGHVQGPVRGHEVPSQEMI